MNKIILKGDISTWNVSASYVRNKLSQISGDVEVEISSYGGSVFEGIEIYNILKDYDKNKGKVTTIVNSKAMSIASLIFLAGSKRKAYDNSTIMIHKAWTWLAGNADELKKEAEILTAMDKILVKTYSKFMNKTEEEIWDVVSKEGWFIGKESLKESGFVDEFVESGEETDELAQANYRKAMARFSAEAKERDEKPDFDEVQKALLNCNDGKCILGGKTNTAIPSDNVKLANSKIGADMEFNQENFDVLASQNKVFKARIETLEAREANLKHELETTASALDVTKAELSKFEGMEAKLSDAEEKLADAKTRVAEAIACGVDSATAVAMLGAESAEKASALANEFRASNGGIGEPDGNMKADKNPWGDFKMEKR